MNFGKENRPHIGDEPLAAMPPKADRIAAAAVLKGVWLYVVTLLVLTAIAWCLVEVRAHIFHEGFPDSSLFVEQDLRFTDFTYLSERVAHYGERDMLSRTDFKSPYPYPVPSVYAYLFFVRLFPDGLNAYLFFAVASFVIATGIFSFRLYQTTPARLPQIAVWITLLLGFPLIFLLDRANIEAAIWVLILLGVVGFTRNRMFAAAMLLALAASMKIFPGLLFLLFLAKRKYGAFALAIVATALFSILALAGVGPSIRQAAADSSKSASFLRDSFITTRKSPEFDHSLFGAIKQALYLYHYHHQDLSQLTAAITKSLTVYSFLVPLAVILLYWFRLRHLPVMNQLASYLVLCVLLPYVSYEYTLIYVYIVWGLFLLFLLTDVVSGRVAIPYSAIKVVMFSCAVIFAPLRYLRLGRSFGVGGQVKALLLILILLTLMKIPMPSSMFGELVLEKGDENPSNMERSGA